MRGVVARDEGDAGSAVAGGAAELEPVDIDRQVRKRLGPGRFGPVRSGCDRPWQKSPAPNMVLTWYGPKVM